MPEMVKKIKEGEEGLENIKEKRKVKPTKSLKSPYLQRVVVMKNNVHEMEKKVADMIFSTRGDLDDVLFHTYFVDGQRVHFESFKEGNEISSRVIDMWAYILNIAEEKRSPGSLRKLYCHTSVITPEMENMAINSKVLKSKFEENMNSLLFLSNAYQSIRDIDRMFFPMMLAKEHYYVVCFNLKEPQLHILDNMDHDQSIRDRYQKKLVYLRYLFLKFLKENGYPHVEALSKYKVSNVKMPWQTKNNYIDCGIFTMRHVETYLGNEFFDAGFEREGKEQNKQIEDLRKKYLTKILLSDCNQNRKVVEMEVQEYQSLSLKEKRMLQNMSAKNIAERATKYFENEASALLRKK